MSNDHSGAYGAAALFLFFFSVVIPPFGLFVVSILGAMFVSYLVFTIVGALWEAIRR